MDKKLKIAIIGSRGYPYVYSGYETLVKELSERLVQKGHIVRIYCHKSLFKERPKSMNGIELIYTPSIKSKFLSQFLNSFFSTLHFCISSFDIGLYVNSANGPLGILTKIFGKKTCINVDGLEWLRPKWKGLGSYYFKIASKFATIFFDEIITVTHGDQFGSKPSHSKLRDTFPNSKLIIYGHTHYQIFDDSESPWVMNPGASGHTRNMNGGPCFSQIHIDNGLWDIKQYCFN